MSHPPLLLRQALHTPGPRNAPPDLLYHCSSPQDFCLSNVDHQKNTILWDIYCWGFKISFWLSGSQGLHFFLLLFCVSASCGAWHLTDAQWNWLFLSLPWGCNKVHMLLPAQFLNLACPKQNSGIPSQWVLPQDFPISIQPVARAQSEESSLTLILLSPSPSCPIYQHILLALLLIDPKSYHFSLQHHHISNRPWQWSLNRLY